MIKEKDASFLFGNQRPRVLATLQGKGSRRLLTVPPLSPLRYTFAGIDAVITYVSLAIKYMTEHWIWLLLKLRVEGPTHWVRVPLVYRRLSARDVPWSWR